MKKSKILSLILASTMIMSTLAGCGSKEPAESNTTEDSNSSVEESKEDSSVADDSAADDNSTGAESGSITLGIWPEDTETEAIATHTDYYVPAFNAMHPDVEAVPAYYKYAPDTYVAMATAGNAPTVFESWYTEPEKLIRNGLVKDITDVLNERGWADSMSPAIRDLLSDDNGRIYGVPRDAYSLGLMINISLFEEAGLVNEDGSVKYPTTWEEVYEDSKIIREKTGQAGFCMQASDGGGGWHWSNIAWNYGATLCIANDDGSYTSNLNSPEAVAAMEWVQMMIIDNCVTDDPTQENWGTGFDRIGTNTAAMYIAANDAVDQPSYRGMNPDEFFLAPMPAGPGGHYTLMGGTPYFFSPDATDDEVRWALDYLEVMGKSPEVSDAARDGWVADAEYRVEKGIPVIPTFPAWVGAVVDEQNKVIDEYTNIDMNLWQAYFDFSKEEGALRAEEPGDTQTMYTLLNDVLQAIIADPNGVDIQAELDAANEAYQAVLDAM